MSNYLQLPSVLAYLHRDFLSTHFKEGNQQGCLWTKYDQFLSCFKLIVKSAAKSRVENASEKSQNVANNRVFYGYKWVVSDLPDSLHTLLVCGDVNIYAYDSFAAAFCGHFYNIYILELCTSITIELTDIPTPHVSYVLHHRHI